MLVKQNIITKPYMTNYAGAADIACLITTAMLTNKIFHSWDTV